MTLKRLVIVSWTLCSIPASACDLNAYVFQDQDGSEAVVKDVRECFGFYNLNEPARSSKKGTCLSATQVRSVMAANKKADLRWTGTRVFTLLYKRKFVYVIEDTTVGSP